MFIHPDDRPRRTAARCQCVARVLLFFSADHRDECTLDQPSHGAPVGWSTGGHLAREFRDIRLLAVTTATGWTRPSAGFAPIASWRSFSTIAKQVISARSAVTAMTAKCATGKTSGSASTLVCTVFRVALA